MTSETQIKTEQVAIKKTRYAKWITLVIAIIGIIVAIFWPTIEKQLIAAGMHCPWPYSLFHTRGSLDPVTNSAGDTIYTLEQLKKFDGTQEGKPILLAVDGKVLDVTEGEKFYGVGKSYHQFAGTACTRALALGSLDFKDINDDVSDFDDKQNKELEETIKFYLEKYPVVGKLA